MGKTDADKKEMKSGAELVAAIAEQPVCSPYVSKKLKSMQKARENTLQVMSEHGTEAIHVMLNLMRSSEKDDIRLKAASKVLEYALGKPSEMKSDSREKQVDLSDDEFDEIVVEGKEEDIQKIIEKRYAKDSKS